MGFPPARTVTLPPVVTAEQWMAQPDCPQQGCGVTEIPGTTMGLPFTRTEGMPLVATPPAPLASPRRCTFGINPSLSFYLVL